MGAYGWGKSPSVIEWLRAEGYRFDFFQAVRLLEILYAPEKPATDDGVELDPKANSRPTKSGATSPAVIPDSEKVEDFVRFKSAVRLSFPTSDISEVRLRELPRDDSYQEPYDSAHIEGKSQLTEMTVNLMGLAGALGPLDMPTTELIIERAANKDTALKDFLDIFNHRLISLLYRIRKMHRIAFENETPGQDKISKYLFSIIGLGTDGLMGRMQVMDRSLLHYAGLLSQEPRSIVGLERLLSDYFKVKVNAHQFVGAWYDLDEEQWTKIGEHERQNNVLGEGAVVVGTRVWDQQAGIEIRLGPLTLKQFLSFIPIGWGYRALCDLTRFYLGDTLDVSFRLVLKSEELRLSELGPKNTSLLGWTSWLTSYPDMNRAPWLSSSRPPWLNAVPSRVYIAPEDDSQVVLPLSAPPAEFKSDKLPLFFQLPPAELDKLIGSMEARDCKEFEVIMKQGDKGDSMFAIRSGKVRVTRREEDGKEMRLGELVAGECFGEMSLLLGKHREATVIALEKCEILELHKKEFKHFAARNPRWARSLKAYRFWQFGNYRR